VGYLARLIMLHWHNHIAREIPQWKRHETPSFAWLT